MVRLLLKSAFSRTHVDLILLLKMPSCFLIQKSKSLEENIYTTFVDNFDIYLSKYEVSRKFWFEWSKCTTSAGQNQDLCYGIRKEKEKKKDEIWLISFMIEKECWRQTSGYMARAAMHKYFVSINDFLIIAWNLIMKPTLLRETRQKAPLNSF